MKRLNSYFMTGMMALAMLSSCSNEDNPGENPLANLPKAVTTFKITLGGASTKALTGDLAGTAEEQNIKNLTLLVFQNTKTGENVKDDFSAVGNLEVIHHFANLTPENGQLKANVETTIGNKVVIALANNPEDATAPNHIDYTEGMTYTDFMAQTGNTDLAAVSGGEDATSVHIVSTENGFQMISAPAGVHVKEGDITQNVVALTVSRLASKIQLQFNPDAIKLDEDFIPEGIQLKASAAKFVPAQLHKSMFVLAPAAGYKGQYKPDAAEGEKINPDLTTHGTALPAPEQWYDAETTEWSGTPGKSAYVSENIIPVTNPVRKFATALVVETKLNITKYTDGGNPDPNGDFWAICLFTKPQANPTSGEANYLELDKANPYKGIYSSFAAAQLALADLTPEDGEMLYAIVHFKGGMAYYRINLENVDGAGLADLFSVKRNSYYHVSVSALANVGWNKPTDLVNPGDEGDIQDDRVGISATITVANWTAVIQDDEVLQ